MTGTRWPARVGTTTPFLVAFRAVSEGRLLARIYTFERGNFSLSSEGSWHCKPDKPTQELVGDCVKAHADTCLAPQESDRSSGFDDFDLGLESQGRAESTGDEA
jgi:hypothetical protein